MSQKTLHRIILTVIASVVVYMSWVAYQLSFSYHDSYSILINAKYLAFKEGLIFVIKRFVLLPVILAPLFVVEKILHIDGGAFLWAKMLMVLNFVVLLWVLYKILRLYFSRTVCLLGVLLLSLNRLILHQVPFIKEDLLSTTLMSLSFYYYLCSLKKTKIKYYLLTSAFISLTILARYNLLPTLFAVIGLHYLYLIIAKKKTFAFKDITKKFVFFFIIPSVLFILVPALVYGYVGLTSYFKAPLLFIKNLLAMFSENHSNKDSIIENFDFVVLSVTWPVIFLFFIGVNHFQKNKERLFFFLWLVIFFGIQTFVLTHKEARYILPVFIPFYYFVVSGLDGILRILKNKKRLQLVVVLGLLMAPVFNGFKEMKAFADPFYRNDYQGRVARLAGEMAQENQIFWFGPMYAMHPEDYIFHIDDEYYSMYHFYSNAIIYYADKKPRNYKGAELVSVQDPEKGLFIRGIDRFVQDGDVVIINPHEREYTTKYVPQDLKPLQINKIRKIEFNHAILNQPNLRLFRDEMSKAEILVKQEDGRLILLARNVPLDALEPYIWFSHLSEPSAMPLVETKNGEFSLVLNNMNDININSILLYGYSRVKIMPHP